MHMHDEVLSTRVLETTEDLYSLPTQRGQAFETGGNHNPFARWEWTYHWWRIFGRTDGRLRDRLHIVLHTDTDGSTRGVTPLVETRFTYGLLTLTKLRNVGAIPGANIVEMFPYIWSRDYEIPVARSLAGELYTHRRDYLWADIKTVPLDRPFGHELAESPVGTSGSWQSPTPYFPVKLPDTWDALRSRLTKIRGRISARLRSGEPDSAAAATGASSSFSTSQRPYWRDSRNSSTCTRRGRAWVPTSTTPIFTRTTSRQTRRDGSCARWQAILPGKGSSALHAGV